jgi:hypothetical protein
MNWFMGPLRAFSYYKKLTSKKEVSQFFLFWLSVKLFMHAVYWVFGPVLMIAMLITASLHSLSLLLVAFILSLVYLTLPIYLTYINLGKLTKVNENPFLFTLLTGGALLFYLLHGLAACLSALRHVQSSLTNRAVEKGKTDMG